MTKARRDKGFSLAEVLVAILILAMVTAVAAAGIPAAIRAYRGAVDISNAELLMTTTTNTLRNHLDLAKGVTVSNNSGTTITYRASDGSTTEIRSSAGQPVKISEYVGYNSADDPGVVRDLVSYETASKEMYVTIGSAAWADGVLTLTDLEVHKGTDVLITVDSYVIKTEK